jgi:xylose isomerase
MELALVVRHILLAGGFTTGGFNFDAHVRRQSVDLEDLFHAHIGGIDALARALLIADRIIEDQQLDRAIAERYAGWDQAFGRDILGGKLSLEQIAERATSQNLDPVPRSGRQEALENLVSRLL